MLFLSTLQEFDKLADTLNQEQLEKFSSELLEQIGYNNTNPKDFVQEKIAGVSPKLVGAINDSIDLGQVYYFRVIRPKKKKNDNNDNNTTKKQGDSFGKSIK